MADYVLTEDDLDTFADDDPPIIRAARNSNSNILKAVLKHWASLPKESPRSSRQASQISPNFQVDGALSGIYRTPLVQAIDSALPENVTSLLHAGADPNGIEDTCLSDYSVRFIRGRDPRLHSRSSHIKCPPRATILANIAISQLSPYTDEEIRGRRTGCARFWSEMDFPASRFRSTPARTALEIAAKKLDIGSVNELIAAGADTSWWTVPVTQSMLPEVPSHSALCTSSPLHEAILSTADIAKRQEMVRHLLSISFSPNTLPFAAPTCCLPTHSVVIAFGIGLESGLELLLSLAVYDILVAHPLTDIHARTPIFSVHVLHFAVAHLSVPLLQALTCHAHKPLHVSSAGTTALGHTLLHIACLPLTDHHLNIYSPKIYQSIHDVRTLSTKWIPRSLEPTSRIGSSLLRSWADFKPFEPYHETETEALTRQRQLEVILWLLGDKANGLDLGAKDVHGNTAMHYLAGAMVVNVALVKILTEKHENGEQVWNEAKNRWGWTPKDLYEDGECAVQEKHKSFWVDSGDRDF